MSDVLSMFAALAPQADEQIMWPPLQLRVRAYLASELPPLDLVTSVRAIVRRDSQLMLVRDPISTHILPGGRREPGETLEQTLAREVLEETGWTIRDARLLGVLHFYHLTPRPAEYRYPYPNFLHIVYTATAVEYDESQREVDGYELSADFRPLADVLGQPISRGEQALLQTMIARDPGGWSLEAS